jgi:hypothetical protein
MQSNLVVAKSGELRLGSMMLARCRPQGEPEGRLRHMCKTCGREYASYDAFVRRHGECSCPALVTSREEKR